MVLGMAVVEQRNRGWKGKMAPAAARSAGAVGVGVAIFISVALTTYFIRDRRSKKKNISRKNGLVEAIGNTPLIRINSLSAATGCQVTFYLFSSLLIFSHLFSFFLISSLYEFIPLTTNFSSDSRQVRVLESRRQRQRPCCSSNHSRG